MLCFDINGFGVGRRVAERLHGEIGGEAKAGQVLQFIAGHGSGCVLRANRCHLRFAVGAGANTLDAAGTSNHFLSKREASICCFWHIGLTEEGALTQSQRLARFRSQPTANNEINATACTNFVEQYIGAEIKLGDYIARFVQHLAIVDTDIDDIPHAHLLDRCFENKGASIFHGVVENRRNFATNADTTHLFVRHACHGLSKIPKHAVGG